jgi:hypothetical protein
MPNAIKLDANDVVFFQRELEHIKAKTYDVIRPERGARSAFPISYDAGEGANFITYRQFDRAGMAKIVADYADDLPMAEISGKEFTQPVRDIGMAFQYSHKEIRESNLTQKSLEQRRANAAVEGIEDKLNQVAWHGDADFGLIGFFSNPNIPTGNVPNGSWDTATAAEIYNDIETAVLDLLDISNGVHEATEVQLPPKKYAKVFSTRMADGTDTTVAKFAEMNLNVKFSKFVELKGAGAGGTDRMVVAEKSPDNYTLEIPMELKMLPPEQRNLAYVVNDLLATGGVIVYRPLAISFNDGI